MPDTSVASASGTAGAGAGYAGSANDTWSVPSGDDAVGSVDDRAAASLALDGADRAALRAAAERSNVLEQRLRDAQREIRQRDVRLSALQRTATGAESAIAESERLRLELKTVQTRHASELARANKQIDHLNELLRREVAQRGEASDLRRQLDDGAQRSARLAVRSLALTRVRACEQRAAQTPTCARTSRTCRAR